MLSLFWIGAEIMIDKERIENAVKEILIAIGEDPEREGLLETPKRVANMYCEVFSGIGANPNELVKTFNEKCVNEMVIVKDIPLYSMCEHHLLPFIGVAHIAYIPSDGKIVGLSKFARIVDVLSKRPQLQERLTVDIANTIMEGAHPKGVVVVIEAEHLCMTMRGIKKPGTRTVTNALTGIFREDKNAREEAISLIKG